MRLDNAGRVKEKKGPKEINTSLLEQLITIRVATNNLQHLLDTMMGFIKDAENKIKFYEE